MSSKKKEVIVYNNPIMIDDGVYLTIRKAINDPNWRVPMAVFSSTIVSLASGAWLLDAVFSPLLFFGVPAAAVVASMFAGKGYWSIAQKGVQPLPTTQGLKDGVISSTDSIPLIVDGKNQVAQGVIGQSFINDGDEALLPTHFIQETVVCSKGKIFVEVKRTEEPLYAWKELYQKASILAKISDENEAV